LNNLLPDIRNAARAVIIRNEQLLLLRKEGGGKPERYALPGGGQDTGETLQQALIRECREEIGTTVSVGKLLLVADFFKQRDSSPPSTRHVLELMFQCGVPGDYTPTSGHHPDKHQTGVLWMPLTELERIQLFPTSLGRHVMNSLQGDIHPYLGLID
jgi:ADP-ribose pyrophosphatase YjhB (NUDIX family)